MSSTTFNSASDVASDSASGTLVKIKTTTSDDVDEELVESLIDTFPASDPPAWIPLARVGTPKRQKKLPDNRR